ncbi:MAG: hypothetical protein H0T79_13235 [Deltaproteobacteria bacterium]|nr:hypothetical protein [Deltaproteobacteria bacterium]
MLSFGRTTAVDPANLTTHLSPWVRLWRRFRRPNPIVTVLAQLGRAPVAIDIRKRGRFPAVRR